jgi:hypothetical protein
MNEEEGEEDIGKWRETLGPGRRGRGDGRES